MPKPYRIGVKIRAKRIKRWIENLDTSNYGPTPFKILRSLEERQILRELKEIIEISSENNKLYKR